MDLRRLTQNTGCRLLRGDALTEITSVCCDSRCAGPGALFVCLPGRHADGHDFAAQAVAAGAAAVLCTHDVPGLPAGCAVLLAGDPRRAMAALAARLYGEPARAMTMIGVTGTKGKTTTAHLLAAVLQADGRRVGLVGTNGVCWPGHRHDLNHTTPESCDLQLLLRRMADDGCDTCVMEVSSLGLKFDRAAEIEFAVGVFTNLSPDHIGPDEHADFAEYLFWKRALFRRCRVGVFNNDDPHAGKIMQGLPCRAVTYGIGCPADVRAGADFALTRAGGRLGAAFTVDGARYAVGMPGAFSVYNALAALTAARVLGAGEDAIHAGLAGAVVCGRVEPVPLDAPFTVVIDYAHNEAAAECLLRTLRAYRPTRLVAVFGCGGARSRLRRFGMGSVCARLADFCIITEDNSRGEPVEHILADIRAGLRLGNPAMLFFTLFSNAETGPINSILLKLGIVAEPVRWLSNVWTARGLVGLMNFLMWFGNTTIILMAAIMGVDPGLYEAAQLDGASSTTMFWRITIPLIRPLLVYTLITSLIGGLQMFDVPQVLTNGKGDPNGSTNTIIMYLNQHLYSKNYGTAGAISVLMFLLCAVLCVIIYFTLTQEDDGLTREQRKAEKARIKAAKAAAKHH